ncbi:Putative protein [Zobellia galactanivorans]|uniref:Uncharacterized protein n=1 Tax=Zobellia galactanivorans (strain DSM 12802 / CCUG 47099 / CIP 106680 / NCIMB 13871 / Dsij) TaxID=63186 RepID=G0L9D3_ZOBGA|nr:Putative protein [Zobellia galactanivorans]
MRPGIGAGYHKPVQQNKEQRGKPIVILKYRQAQF